MPENIELTRAEPHPNFDPPFPGNISDDLFEVALENESLSLKDVVHLAATLTGDKTGSAFVFLGGGAEEIADELDASHVPHKLASRRSGGEVSVQLLAVASTTDAYALMPPYEETAHIGGFTGQQGEREAKFLGIPDEDVGWLDEEEYTNGGKPLFENYDVEPPEDDDLLYLLSYICRPTQQRVQAAVEVAKSYRDACARVGDALDDSRITSLPEKAIQEQKDEETTGLYLR